MLQGQSSLAIGAAAAAARSCPVCGQPVQPDALGIVECGCGWGGPGDPLEATRGLARANLRWVRQTATAQARRELERFQWHLGTPIRPGALYTGVLTMASTIILIAPLVLFAGSVWLTISLIRDQAWISAAITLLFAIIFGMLFVPTRHKFKHIEAPLARFPQLTASFEEVCARTGMHKPDRVVLEPGTDFFVYQHSAQAPLPQEGGRRARRGGPPSDD